MPFDPQRRRDPFNDLPGENRMRRRTPELRENARRMRREPTATESALWEELRDRRLDGLRFRRQHAVGTFIFDFYCPEARLVLEVDGGVHDTADVREHDVLRDETVTAHGCRVLRVRNTAILNDMPGVLDAIREAASLRHPVEGAAPQNRHPLSLPSAIS